MSDLTAHKIAVLRSASIFAQTPDDILSNVAGLLKLVEFRAGQLIFHKGDRGDCLYIIENGQVRVHDGERTLSFMGAGQVFGEMALLDAEPRVASVTAVQDTRLFRLDQAPFYELMTDQQIARAVIGVLCRNLRGQARHLAQDFTYIQQVGHITAAAAALESGLFDPHSLDALGQRADEVGQLARVFQRMARETKAQEQLEIGRKIQASFLPAQLMQPPGWEIAARFQPARQVAGDFYDAFPLIQNRRVGLVIADVCDKGVGAALYMALFRTLIRAFAQQHYSLRWMDTLAGDKLAATPDERRQALPSTGTMALRNAITLTNNYIARTHTQASMFATIFFGVLDPASGALAYVNGGHEPPVIVGASGLKTRLEPTGPLVGLFPGANFDVREVTIEPGDMLVAFTDGVTEAHAPDGELYGAPRLYALLEHYTPSAAALLDGVETRLREHTSGVEQSDDITMLAVKRQVAPLSRQ